MKSFFYSNWFALIIIIVLIGFDIAIHIPVINIECNYFGAMIGFVGVLATFVVISNYAQVKEIEKKFDKAIADTERRFNESLAEIEEKIERVNELVGEAKDYASLMQKLKGEGHLKDG
jgi:hypothetical protein